MRIFRRPKWGIRIRTNWNWHYRPVQAVRTYIIPGDKVMELGVYRHYKGGHYAVLMLGRDSNNDANREDVVIYMSLSAPYAGSVNVRRESEFLELVELPDGETVPRFTFIMPAPRGSEPTETQDRAAAAHSLAARQHGGFTAQWKEDYGPYYWVTCLCGETLGSVLKPVTAAQQFELHLNNLDNAVADIE
jgi:hypothetical protein